METHELENIIKEFLKRKHFEHPFIQECITEFIEGHTRVYGDIIPVDALLARLETNLDKITFDGFDLQDEGKYIGRVADNNDQNEILLHFDESDLELSQADQKMWEVYTEKNKIQLLQDLNRKREIIKRTLLHELTHAAYTIKGENGIGASHIFSKSATNILGQYGEFGNNKYVEAIVNYISSRISGKKPNEVQSYVAETNAIYMLAEKVDEKDIIKSAWNSDEDLFKHVYIEGITQDIETGEKSYESFQRGMSELILIRQRKLGMKDEIAQNKQALEKIQEILDGKRIDFMEFNPKSKKIGKIEPIEFIYEPINEERNKLSDHRIAQLLSKSRILMKLPFIKKYVDKRLNILPEAKKQVDPDERRNAFIKELSNNGEYYNLQPVIPEIKEQPVNQINEQTNEGNVR